MRYLGNNIWPDEQPNERMKGTIEQPKNNAFTNTVTVLGGKGIIIIKMTYKKREATAEIHKVIFLTKNDIHINHAKSKTTKKSHTL